MLRGGPNPTTVEPEVFLKATGAGLCGYVCTCVNMHAVAGSLVVKDGLCIVARISLSLAMCVSMCGSVLEHSVQLLQLYIWLCVLAHVSLHVCACVSAPRMAFFQALLGCGVRLCSIPVF